MQIDETTFRRMPAHLRAFFSRDANPGKKEVVEAFPTTGGGSKRNAKPAEAYKANHKNDVYGEGMGGGYHAGFDDAGGSAARFFYSAKASRADRAGSKHPTVKPIALMAWLCRLVTPPGGTILDPFAGSGTTGAAAAQGGFNCIMCEREDEYVGDIRARFGQNVERESTGTGASDLRGVRGREICASGVESG